MIRPGVFLLTLLQPQYQSASVVRILMQKKVTAVAIDLITDERGRYLFADILDEIDGRAAIVLASELLSNRSGGKGVLLGGIPWGRLFGGFDYRRRPCRPCGGLCRLWIGCFGEGIR